MNRFLPALLVLLLASSMQSQNAFQKAYSLPFHQGLIPSCISYCSDGGYLIATGTFDSYQYNNGQALMHIDAYGNMAWSNILMADPNSFITIVQAEQCPNGYIVFGESNGYDSLTFDPVVCYFLTRLNNSGNILWTKRYTVPGSNYAHPRMRQSPGGGFIISTSVYDIMGAIKTDANGNVLWSYAYCGDTTTAPKNPGFDCTATPDGGLLFSGKSVSNIELVKTTSTGFIQWTKNMTNGNAYYHANSIIATSDGGFVLAGYQDTEGFLMKLDASGAQLWYKSFIEVYSFEQVLELPGGELEVIGYNVDLVNGDWMTRSSLMRFDANGNVLRAVLLAGGVAFLSGATMCKTVNGKIALTGNEIDPYNQGTGIVLFVIDPVSPSACQFTPMSLTADIFSGEPADVPQYPVGRRTLSCRVSDPTYGLVASNYAGIDFCLLFGEPEQKNPPPQLSVFPSPLNSGGILHLEMPDYKGNATIAIYDATGNLVQETDRTLSGSSDIEMETKNLSNGIYFLRVIGEKKNTIAAAKFIVN